MEPLTALLVAAVGLVGAVTTLVKVIRSEPVRRRRRERAARLLESIPPARDESINVKVTRK